MVIDVVRNRGAAAPSFTMTVKTRNYLKLLTFGPHRIVIVFTVDAESVEPKGIARSFRILARNCRNRPLDIARHQYRFEPQHVNRIFEFLQRLLRGVHRNCRDRSNPVPVHTPDFGAVPIQCAAGRPSYFFVFEMSTDQAEAWVQHAKIQAHLIEPFIHQFRKHRGSKIARVPGWKAPEWRTFGPEFPALLR
jgi:hypothetical protein